MTRPSLALLAGALLSMVTLPATATDRVDGEASRTAPAPEVQWRAASPAAVSTTRLRYGDLPVARIAALHTANAGNDARKPKPTQIGIGRVAAAERTGGLPPLRWQRLQDGSHVARIEVTSPVAMGLRVGLRAEGVPLDAEWRFLGSERPLGEVVFASAREVAAATPRGGLYWTPSTDGETQTIELWLPPGRSPHAVRVSAPELSHLLTNPRRDFRIVEKIGESGACNVDTACRVAELGPAFVHAKNAVAHMVFVEGGGSYICTGTLLNDTVPVTQEPWFYSAHHCIDSQTVASTLNTYWNYEATACGSGVSTTRTLLSGGADYLFSEANTDALLLKLRNPPPAFATFAGWDASVLASNAPVFAIHHPRGDAKKVSSGAQIPSASDGFNHGVGWTSGTTEGGSSGSGLFTLDGQGRYRLRGGLYGGDASCANTGNLGNTLNRDWYSRLDVVFPQIRQYLAPQPARRNGAQPLRPD